MQFPFTNEHFFASNPKQTISCTSPISRSLSPEHKKLLPKGFSARKRQSRGDYSSSLHKKLREARFLSRVQNKEGKCSQHRKQSESLIPDDASGRRINHGLRSQHQQTNPLACVCVMLCKYFVACHWAGKCARGMSHRRSCAARGGRGWVRAYGGCSFAFSISRRAL